MSDKKRTSITVDPDVYRYLQRNEVNQSGLINDLVKEYKDNKSRQVAALELQYKRLTDERDDLRERAEKKHQEAMEVKALLDRARTEEQEELAQAREALKDTKELTPDNPAVQNWAEKCDMTPEALLEELE